MRWLNTYFTTKEKLLWSISAAAILAVFFVFDKENYLSLIASLIGVTSLLFCAKGNPVGQVLMILFSLLYGVISWSFSYYGEMITYVGMTMPMAVFSLVSWLKHPYQGRRSEVQVDRVGKREAVRMFLLAAVVTAGFWFLLKWFRTANLIPSTLSVTTSFLAAYLTYRRSPYYAIAYAANDVILIVLWFLAALDDPAYLSVMVCFLAFLANDIYGFLCWRKMERRQASQ